MKLLKTKLAASIVMSVCAVSYCEACAQFYFQNGRSYVKNNCNRTIMVTWQDQGYCSTRCAAYLRPGGWEMITSIQGSYSASERYWP